MAKLKVEVTIPGKHAHTKVEQAILDAGGAQYHTGSGFGLFGRELTFEYGSRRTLDRWLPKLEAALDKIEGSTLTAH